MRRLLYGLVAVTVVSVVASSAVASVTVNVGDKITVTNPNGEAPYLVTVDQGVSVGDSFFTFCVESKRYFSPGSQYIVDSITTGSITSGKQLTGYTAWVYTQWLNGNVTAANSVVQHAVWAGMVTDASDQSSLGGLTSEYSTHTSGGTTDLDATVYDAGGIGYTNDYIAALNGGDTSYLFNVRIMNEVDANGGDHQDHLVVIPEPASLAIWSLIGLSWMGLNVYRRRRHVGGGRTAWPEENRMAIRAMIETRVAR